jgi:hypothetical protein
VLSALTKARLLDLARELDLVAPASATKDTLADLLLASGQLRFRELLQRLGRDELRAVCRAHDVPAESRSRPALVAALLQAHGAADTVPPHHAFSGRAHHRELPTAGDIVRCRHRQWLVEQVTEAPSEGDATRVRLVCLDDDNQGKALEVLWELELGAATLRPESHGLGAVARMDEPRWFAAYLHALKWSSVTATDPKLFQAPFRAGIKLMAHQLTPLRKALLLPRANLFIADDVGLGKTIEAGLVLQELLLRQRVDFVLIVCPPSIALQWRDEMMVRFGLQFEIYNRAFVGRRQRERGFGVNPWSTHTRFIISYQTLRRPEYRDLLLAHLGEKARKSLLILDEAHTAAPASAHSGISIDSRLTRVIRDVTPRFENRLFLSATPHNGHSNSFSALLEMLDPNRFTRAIEVSPAAREAVMVRRLKEDLRKLGREQFPERKVIRIELRHDGNRWNATPSDGAPGMVGETAPAELQLSKLLAEYTALMRPGRGRGQLVFINLQKRLLSSVDAFARTLELHASAVVEGREKAQLDLAAPPSDTLEQDDEYGPDDDAEEAAQGHDALASSRLVQSPAGRARQLLDEMVRLSRAHRAQPDAKALTLLHWIRQHQCAGARVGGLQRGTQKSERAWTERRVLIFTEYGDTKKWLKQILLAAIDGSDRADERILEFHGGMSDDQRAAVQDAFNAPPAEHPVRILLATDAAREGVNLQGFCADLFHFDIPWNPARLEQRNGRIDRTLQPAPVVRCHYFVYPDRPEDFVLDAIVDKVEVIRKELGSLGSVVMERLDAVFARGIDARTKADLDSAADAGGLRETARTELEIERADLSKLAKEIDEAGRILERSAKVLNFDPPLLRDAIDVGLELAGIHGKLTRVGETADAWALPAMPDSWQPTLDSLRATRDPDELLWDWRKKPLPPVTFTAPERISDRRVHLHLSHPLVQRVMGRFLSQGFSAHDLSRVTVVRSKKDYVARAIAFGRLSLFGPGATRLHDQLIAVAAPWLEGGAEGHLVPGTDAEDRKAVDRLETLLSDSPTLDAVGPAIQARFCASAAADFKQLWEHIKIEADALAHDAEAKLKTRGRAESEALTSILETQRTGIEKALGTRGQGELPFDTSDREAREQWQSETKHLEARLRDIAKDIDIEPKQIEALYQVRLQRLEPVGLVYVWPETKG